MKAHYLFAFVGLVACSSSPEADQPPKLDGSVGTSEPTSASTAEATSATAAAPTATASASSSAPKACTTNADCAPGGTCNCRCAAGQPCDGPVDACGDCAKHKMVGVCLPSCEGG
ncbi:MAG: hypothetical protein HOV80_13115 [Polyangiaceae bacterium]|nr:hypothetical protein [Polyangiaceae bacterium]